VFRPDSDGTSWGSLYRPTYCALPDTYSCSGGPIEGEIRRSERKERGEGKGMSSLKRGKGLGKTEVRERRREGDRSGEGNREEGSGPAVFQNMDSLHSC